MAQTVSGAQDQTGRLAFELGRSSDARLSLKGKKQAEFLGQFIANIKIISVSTAEKNRLGFNEFEFTHLYSSPMIRALETAIPITSALNLTPVIWPELHEVGGVWRRDKESSQKIGLPGAKRSFFRQHYPQFQLPEQIEEKGWWNRPHEKSVQGFERAECVLERLKKKHGNTEDRVAVVSHGNFYNCLLHKILGLSTVEIEYIFMINNAGITRIDFCGNNKLLVYQNRLEFIPPGLVS